MIRTPFVLLTITRSGSTWLQTLLNGQPDIASYEELFLPRPVEERYAFLSDDSPPRLFARRAELPSPRPRAIWRYLDEVSEFRTDVRAFGFKLILGQLREAPELPAILLARRYRLIVLLRDNLFEGAVSRRVMDVTGDAHGRSADDVRERVVRLDPGPLVREMRRRKRGIEILRALRRTWPFPAVEVRYDDLVSNQSAALRPVLKALRVGAEPIEVASPLKRRVQRPYTEFIENFEEIRAAVVAAGLGAALPVTP